MKIAIILFFQFLVLFCFSQEKNLYNPQLNGKVQLKQAIELAQKNNNHILIQVDGNWCPWCIRFHKFLNEIPKIDSLVQSSYIHVTLNYSRENKNEESLKQLEFPQRFGFPVLVILDQNVKEFTLKTQHYSKKTNRTIQQKFFNFFNIGLLKQLTQTNI